MRSYMELLLQQYITTAQAAPLSLSVANARIWAVEYLWNIAAIRSKFTKLDLELKAAGLS